MFMRPFKITDIENVRVIHPLDDDPETKCGAEGLGQMSMTPAVRISLLVLRAYLTAMALMLMYHVADMAGLLTNK